MSDVRSGSPKHPPAWFMHAFWRAHRLAYRLSGGRFLWTPSRKHKWGAFHLTTTGRVSGLERSVILGYLEDGPNLVTLAMNGGEEGHPAWWRNLEAHPDAVVRLAHQEPRPVRARAAGGDERERLWARWVEIDPSHEAFEAHRSTPIVVVVLEPQPVSDRIDAAAASARVTPR
jgi:F420H(2)-dependent quinone reductase